MCRLLQMSAAGQLCVVETTLSEILFHVENEGRLPDFQNWLSIRSSRTWRTLTALHWTHLGKQMALARFNFTMMTFYGIKSNLLRFYEGNASIKRKFIWRIILNFVANGYFVERQGELCWTLGAVVIMRSIIIML